MPIRKVSSADRHHGATDKTLLAAPIPRNVTPVSPIATTNGVGIAMTNGISGTSPQTTNATKVLHAAFSGDLSTSATPYSSTSIVFVHVCSSALTASTSR